MERSKTILDVLLVVRWPVGGIRTFLKYVIRSFPENKCNFHIVSTRAQGMSVLQNDLGSLIKSWVMVPEDAGSNRSLMYAVFKYLNSNNIDLIHAHGFTSAIVCVLPSIISRKPMILTSHDVLNAAQFYGITGLIKKRLLGLALKKCKVIQSVSDDAQENLLSFFPSEKSRSLVIKNGIDTRQFLLARPVDIRASSVLDEQKIIIGFFGRFMAQKGFRFLIDAVQILRNDLNDDRFQVVCFGSGAFIREEQAEIVRQGLDPYFTFIPFVSDVSGAMKGCDLIVMPSRWEACGLVAMEALASGVPFVGSDCIGLREVLLETPAVVVRTGDPLSLAKGIQECSRIERSVFEKFAQVAAERFDVKHTSMKISSMYERAVL
ncbi:MAG: glycosyltransferase family 4 protein [Marinobacter sp.]|nr:glycosyltransferase family 4 protein [Marinobacter sp.]